MKKRELCLKYLEWDSEQLGVPCGLIDETRYESCFSPCELTHLIKQRIEQASNIKFITIKLHQHYLNTVNALIKWGAMLLDTEITFVYQGKQVSQERDTSSQNYHFEFCNRIASQVFLELSEKMRFSRFFLDSNIPTESAIRLWKTSIKNHCEGFADQLLIAFSDSKPCGLITLQFKQPWQIFLHIVGVLQGYQRKGIGRLMLMKVLAQYASEYSSIYVETQSVNIPAQKVYQKVGFKYHSLKYVLHYWKD